MSTRDQDQTDTLRNRIDRRTFLRGAGAAAGAVALAGASLGSTRAAGGRVTGGLRVARVDKPVEIVFMNI